MAAETTSLREPATSGSEAQNPAVLNLRRPGPVHTDDSVVNKPHADMGGTLDSPAQPRTVLRLPDLAAVVTNVRRELNPAAIAQWSAIGLGGLLALWLIFGGRAQSTPSAEKAPPWSPPGGAAVEMAPPPGVAAPAGAPAPQWQPEGAAPFNPQAPPTAPTQWQSGAPAAPAAEAWPYEGDAPAAPSDQQQPDWNDPNWGDSVHRQAPAADPYRQEVRTAQRGAYDTTPPAAAGSSPAQALDVTVPVPQ